MNPIDFYKRNEFINRKNLPPSTPNSCFAGKMHKKRLGRA